MRDRTQFNFAQRWRIEQSGSKRKVRRRNKSILTIGVLGVLVGTFLGLPWIGQYALESKLAEIEDNIVYYQDVADTLEEIDRLEADVAQMESFLKIAVENSKDPRTVRAQIRELLPAGASITSFSLQADKSVQLGVTISGPVDLAKFWVNFRDSGLFENFDMKAVSLTDEVQNLSLTLKMKS